jgi:TubC N-terminal docking domain
MNALAIGLLREVSEAGGTIGLEGDMLRLSASEPLPDELRMRLREHKAEIVALLSAAEPANDVVLESQPGQDVAGLPQEIADGVRAILSADGARGIPPQRWPRVQHDAARLVKDGWAREALTLGWTTADLFGCDQRAPWHRLDRSGLVLLLGDHESIDLTSDMATIRTRAGSVLRFPRRPPAKPPVALLWDVLTSRVRPLGWPSAEATDPRIRGTTAHPSKEADGGDVLGRTPPPS